ncbi:hypothetical protein MRX96_023319 [Rhipicephalus microplus]
MAALHSMMRIETPFLDTAENLGRGKHSPNWPEASDGDSFASNVVAAEADAALDRSWPPAARPSKPGGAALARPFIPRRREAFVHKTRHVPSALLLSFSLFFLIV